MHDGGCCEFLASRDAAIFYTFNGHGPRRTGTGSYEMYSNRMLLCCLQAGAVCCSSRVSQASAAWARLDHYPDHAAALPLLNF